MSSILDLEVFVRTADTGSLSAAARSLGLSPAAASIALKRLETRLGSRLLARSTRSMRLTEEGRRYLDSVREALATLAEGEQALRQQSHGLTGLLQLAAPSDFGRNVVLGWLDAFKLEHPNIRLQLMLNDSNADLFRETVDIALRFGVPRDSSLVALPVVPDHRRIPCASPDYLARHGTPRTPTELAQHNTLRYMRQGRANNTWYFRQGAVLQEVEVTGDYLSDDGEIVRRWALAGHGIAYKANLDIARDLKAGRLVQLLPDWQGEPTPFNLMCPHRLQVSERVKVLHRFLQVRCQALLNE
ncbi:LysR family transcriptional regulator [Pseudomonas fluorescens]|jgi:DNA-binding transcriptional LysR family regulator|uniref:LysR family transcriptional regulator n=2 Tax=Pseudomonas TaxID=286 RepID=A0A1B3CSH9_PSEFL|nr:MULTISPECIES: LysR family transcriptional regulator [Pseudomonas]AHC35659.1 LysR family transcriptional regulator [Pseudomonas sp. TKP]AOE67963.1 LysR family transcriptional regulator [Pseudomonas fluorescens]AOE73774.1 LysR family transcriptional regulator [Pseudomonas fluorescens]MBL1305628.1 LysR family transcriptional regulator [Pseudomonas sp.]MDR6576744.1 DNA-binding transcriptional LysR family regulator [Pseudomonas extremaustralis]